MALSNSQYDEIIRTYDARQLKNQHLREAKIRNAYERLPRLKEIDDAIASCSVAHAKRLLDGDESALAGLAAQLAAYRSERAVLLAENGFSDDYFAPAYTCPDCKDTGYADGRRCHCFEQAAIDMIYTQSNLKDILQRENFSTFSFDYYSDTERNPATGLSALDTARDAVEKCRHFIDTFDDAFSNLYFYGDTGIGKTFLSNCVAKELLDRGHSVIYFTAFQLFDILSKGVFQKDARAVAAHQNIFDCDRHGADKFLYNFAAVSVLKRTYSAKEIYDYLHQSGDEPVGGHLFGARALTHFEQLYADQAVRPRYPHFKKAAALISAFIRASSIEINVIFYGGTISCQTMKEI